MQLKTEKQQLQDKVTELLALLGQMNGGQNTDEIHKRFKVSEIEDQFVEWNRSGTTRLVNDSNNISGSFLIEEEESEFMSSSQEEIDILKTESWLNQNDILNQVSHSPSKRILGISNDIDLSFISDKNSDWAQEFEPERLILRRGKIDDDFVNNIFGEQVDNFLSQASMFTLTIVMCLVLCLTGYSAETNSYSNRDYQAGVPGMRTPMFSGYFETYNNSASYLKIGLITLFILIAIMVKWGGWLKRLSFNPRRHEQTARLYQ